MNEVITKRKLVIDIANRTGLKQKEVLSVIEEFTDSVTESLASGDEVVLRNFGTFHLAITKPKIGRNPHQPEKDIPIPTRAVVKFKSGKELKERVAKVLPKLQQSLNS